MIRLFSVHTKIWGKHNKSDEKQAIILTIVFCPVYSHFGRRMNGYISYGCVLYQELLRREMGEQFLSVIFLP